MPEGPSTIITADRLHEFTGKKVSEASGIADLDYDRIAGSKLLAIRTFGKHLLLCFNGFTIRIHFLMFGTLRINDPKKLKTRLKLLIGRDDIRFYTCAVKWLEGDLNDWYDWTADVMNPKWSAPKARKKLREHPDMMVCDALMDQDIFAGVGNIIKCEVLYRVNLHPESRIGKVPPRTLSAMIREAAAYPFEFLTWKRKGTLKKHWLCYGQKKTRDTGLAVVKKITGLGKRRSFFCPESQVLYK